MRVALIIALLIAVSVTVASAVKSKRMQSALQYDLDLDYLCPKRSSQRLEIAYNYGNPMPYIACGTKVGRETCNQPPVEVRFTSAKHDSLYTLVFVDPDSPDPRDPINQEHLHFLAMNIPGYMLTAGIDFRSYQYGVSIQPVVPIPPACAKASAMSLAASSFGSTLSSCFATTTPCLVTYLDYQTPRPAKGVHRFSWFLYEQVPPLALGCKPHQKNFALDKAFVKRVKTMIGFDKDSLVRHLAWYPPNPVASLTYRIASYSTIG